MTAVYKYSTRNMMNFPQQLETPSSEKENAFSRYGIAFVKRAWNLEVFETRDDYLGVTISEIIDSERGCYLNV